MQNKRERVVVIHRSPSENNNEFDDFLNSLDNLIIAVDLSSSVFTIIFGDFNERFSSSWVDDKTIAVGTRLEALPNFHGF